MMQKQRERLINNSDPKIMTLWIWHFLDRHAPYSYNL